jgi:hypothetical protein
LSGFLQRIKAPKGLMSLASPWITLLPTWAEIGQFGFGLKNIRACLPNIDRFPFTSLPPSKTGADQTSIFIILQDLCQNGEIGLISTRAPRDQVGQLKISAF